MSTAFRRGDRVRIIQPDHEYTGCRGTIADAPSDPPPGVTRLGHFVAIDGENGLARPFLAAALEPLPVMRVGRPSAARPAPSVEARPKTD